MMSKLADAAEPQSNYFPWVVWGTIALFYFYQFLLRVSPSVMTDNLMRDLGVHACALGELASYYYIGYTVMQIPVGLLVDRVGVRLPLMSAVSMCIVGCYLFATNDSYFMLSAARLLTGFGSAFAFLSCVKSASLWFNPKKIGLLVGLTLMLGTVGGAVGGPGIGYMLGFLHWREIFSSFLMVGFVLLGLTWFFVKEYLGDSSGSPESKNTRFLDPLKAILLKPQTYIFGLYGGLMYTPLSVFADMWGTPYLMEHYQVPKSVAASVVSMLYLGVGLGAPVSAWFSERIQSHRKMMIIGATASTVIICLALYINVSFAATYILYFSFGAALGVQFLAYASVCQINPLSASGTASAIQNMCAMLSGIVLQPFLGYLLESVWNGTIVGSVPQYTGDNFVYALTVIPGCLFIAIILSLLMKETYPKAC